MLYRKIESYIENHFLSNQEKVLIIDGARQIGKSYIIRHTGSRLFTNFVEINLLEDVVGARIFSNIKSVEDFYLQLSIVAGDKLDTQENTLIFLDEIQEYPQLLTLLKFLKSDNRFNFIASGSLLGVTLAQTTSIPIGSIEIKHMYALDFEEFLIANRFGSFAIETIREKFEACESLDENIHNKLLDLFRKYLLVGGLPDAVNEYIASQNIVRVRQIQNDIHNFYGLDAAKYDKEHKLKIKRIYDMIPSNLEKTKKRVIIKDIEEKKSRTSDYNDEFDYLINAGIALEVKAISNPKFPLIESSGKNLLKLYLNDVGLLTNLLYRNNIMAILNDENCINLGSVYESVVASELTAHGHKLHYYDNKSKGEIDYIIDNYDLLSVMPIEVKSGKDYSTHRALSNFAKNAEYQIKMACVLSNEREIKKEGNILYLPIYFVMFL
ncbi:MAG: AAA family ATPase [bacterium]